MGRRKATPRSGNYGGAKALSIARDNDEIIANGWTVAQCRAIEWSLGGGFVLMALGAVAFGW